MTEWDWSPVPYHDRDLNIPRYRVDNGNEDCLIREMESSLFSSDSPVRWSHRSLPSQPAVHSVRAPPHMVDPVPRVAPFSLIGSGCNSAMVIINSPSQFVLLTVSLSHDRKSS